MRSSMNERVGALAALVATLVLAGCAGPSASGGSGAGSASNPVASSGTTGAGPPPSLPATLGAGEQQLEAGTYRFDLSALTTGGAEYPGFLATFPAGWTASDGWAVFRDETPSSLAPTVAVTFWNVDEVYGDSCQWQGTLLQPGPGVADLVAALVKVPTRNATPPTEVQVGGLAGMFLEWSVPADLAFDDEVLFPECDEDGEGHNDFRSWTAKDWSSTRYHQGPGQVDRLWILDAFGERLVVDASSMPDATAEEIEQIYEIVQSIRFDSR
jgi:hypothetical protein